MASPTKNELDLITKFKGRLSDLALSTEEEECQILLLRFLRARDGNLDKAEQMIRKHFQWKKVEDIENLGSWIPPQILTRDYPYEISGFDKEGSPVLVVPVGVWDVRGICEAGLKGPYVKYVDQLFINVLRGMRESSVKRGVAVSQFICIFVPDGLSAFRQMSSVQAVDTVLETVSRFEANHPETLKAAFVVDSPKVFQVILSVVRPLLNSKTLSKLTVSSNSKEWKGALLDLVEPDELPIRLGGTKTSQIPMLNMGGGGRLEVGSESEDFIALTVGAGRHVAVEYQVENSKTQFNWAFKTDRHDIGFSVLLGGREVVVPYSRHNSHEQVQCGVVKCAQAGKYVLVFDNRFSRWRSKVVRYRVTLEEGREESGAVGEEEDETLNPSQLKMETMSL